MGPGRRRPRRRGELSRRLSRPRRRHGGRAADRAVRGHPRAVPPGRRFSRAPGAAPGRAAGVKIGLRTYDSGELNPYRRQHSGIDARNGRWEVRYDPYDISRIWIATITTAAGCPRPGNTNGDQDSAGHADGRAEQETETEIPPAQVIPLPLFDARKEAEKWW
jgi:hypothetical protein